MQVTNPISRIFTCQNGEQVTMTFTAHNTNFGITHKFDDEEHAHSLPEGQDLVFTVQKKPNGGVSVLRVFFHFLNESGTGGSYDVQLSGSGGGTSNDLPPVSQTGGLVPVRRYTFVVP